MDLSAKVLGTNIVQRLKARAKSSVLRIGSDKLTRADLARVECYNFTAAQSLSEILNTHLNVANISQVFHHVAPEELALPRLGAISLAVLGAAFESRGLGGDAPLEAWMRRHLGNREKLTTFSSIKNRESQDATDERKREKARKHARRNKAHNIRVGRFEGRRALAG